MACEQSRECECSAAGAPRKGQRRQRNGEEKDRGEEKKLLAQGRGTEGELMHMLLSRRSVLQRSVDARSVVVAGLARCHAGDRTDR